MRNTTELANFALMALGVGQIQSIDDAGNSATLCKNWYGHAIRTTQAQYGSTIKRVGLTRVGTPVDGWTYRFVLPPSCLKILAIMENITDAESGIEWATEGGFLDCDLSVAYLKYIVEPRDIGDLDDLVAEAIGYKLALLVGPGLGMDQENAALREVERRFQVADGAARSVNVANRASATQTRLWTNAGRS